MVAEETKEIIRQTVHETLKVEGIDYFKSMEALLRNYKKLQRRITDVDGYMDVFIQHHSKSILLTAGKGSSSTNLPLTEEEALAQLHTERETAFAESFIGFAELERVINLFRDDIGFPVIEAYYFSDTPRTFLDIALSFGIDEKTARRRRTRIVRDMAVCLFGIPAAVSSARFAPDSRP